MPIDNTIHTYFVSGKVYVRQYGAQTAFEFPGLVDTVTLGISEQTFDLPDRTQPGGGNYDQLRRIQNVNVTLNVREFRPAMLARALFGEASTVNAGSVAAEEHVATKGGFIPLEHPGPYTNLSVSTDDTVPMTIGAAGNYRIVPGGIQILDNATDIEDDDVIRVAYEHGAYTRVQSLTSGAPELEIVFVGENEARSDKEVRVKIHRVRLGAAAEKQLLSADDFGALSLTGEVLKDQNITAPGASQYFYEDIVS